MMYKKLFILFISFVFILPASSQSWSMKKARLMSPWSEQIDPSNVLNDYPRPQMERSEWQNLNGLWDFSEAEKFEYKAKRNFDKKILVPFAPESAISGIMDTDHQKNKGKIFLYSRKFNVAKSNRSKEILLHFGAVDWKCQVYINGKRVGEHKGGFDPFYFNITSALQDGEEQEVQVFVQDYQEFGGGLHGKQKITEKTIWYTPVTGIWQTVWLESVDKTYIEKLKIDTDIDKQLVSIKANVNNAEKHTKVTIKIFDKSRLIATTVNEDLKQGIDIPIQDMKLWSPDSPFLYDVEIELTNGNEVTDKVKSYFGMRKISVGNYAGKPCMMLNNEFSFHYGVLDQGYWPDGLYTAPTDEALKFDLIKTKEFGMNMSRKHIKVEPARWYYHCDKMGVLVWQDIPNPGYGDHGKIMGEANLDLRDNFHDEMTRIIESLENYPSIVMWTIYNESWGQPDGPTSKKGVDIARKLDKSRLISIASGWNDHEYGDIKDTHWYPQPNILPNLENKRVSVCGEYGGITLLIDGHRWIGGSDMKYTQVYSSADLKDTFVGFCNRILRQQANGLCAAVYTQLTDLEDEENGLITYDRKVVKVNKTELADIRKAVERNYTHTSKAILPISQYRDVENLWKYKSSDTPLKNKDWVKTSFKDNDWKGGKGGFGAGDLQGAMKNTNWNETHIYLRRWVELQGITEQELDKLEIQVFHDDDCEIYINGVLAAQLDGYTNAYTFAKISLEARATIKLGKPNLIAVTCKQTQGNQFIDLGLYLTDIPRN